MVFCFKVQPPKRNERTDEELGELASVTIAATIINAMANIGRIQSALATASQETTVALANVNFDFSLFRIEAPAEYQPLGAALSTRRRSAAEHGTTHVTAGKLGSLFEQALPLTPNLFKAYGLRASEIAQSPLINPKGSKAYGPFEEHIGVDGTSIWAAATSRKGAVAIHLLACMLARIWPASEAVGIWEQMLEGRQKELTTWDESGAIPFRSLATGQITLSRDQLTEWDASARAWLRAADIAKRLNQKQLMLIVENLNIPVNNDMNVYASVMQAWKTAMTTMDCLISGINHSVQNGAALLGLSSWHLYPDLIVLGGINAPIIHQKDRLIPQGGIVTIGLHGAEPENSRGVYWSLPLAHVRYYEDAITREGSVNSGHSRITFDDIWQVVLGSLFALWRSEGSDINSAARSIQLMLQSCLEALRSSEYANLRKSVREFSWLKHLSEAAKRYLESSGYEQESCKKLVGLGQRRGTLLSRFNHSIPIFGLTASTFVNILRTEDRVHYLRRIAPEYSTETDILVIKICRDTQNSTSSDDWTLQLATVASSKTSISSLSDQSRNEDHLKRWFYGPTPQLDMSMVQRESLQEVTLIEIRDGEEYWRYHNDPHEFMTESKSFRWWEPPAMFSGGFQKPTADEDPEPTKKVLTGLRRLFAREKKSKKPKRVATFDFVYGDPRSAALFRRANFEGVRFRRIYKNDVEVKNDVTQDQISKALNSGTVDPKLFLQHMNFGYAGLDSQTPDQTHLAVVESLRAVATAARIYSCLPNATAALDIVKNGPLTEAKWMSPDDRTDFSGQHVEEKSTNMVLLPYSLSRRATFACISMFESGGFDFTPSQLDKVMAMSTGDSIFVAAAILCDPATRPEPYEIRRIVGNIGRAGIAFLIPPSNPRIKELDLETYEVINHDPYDGKLEDSFKGTTLHLRFSGYESSLEVGDHGRRNREAFFIETMISTHDRGEWVADLDALSSLASSSLGRVNYQSKDCRHTPSERHCPPEYPLTTIDRWEELLEKPRDSAVVRAHGNWGARLAAAAVSVRLGNKTLLLAGNGCWKCSEKTLSRVPEHPELQGLKNARSAGESITYIV